MEQGANWAVPGGLTDDLGMNIHWKFQEIPRGASMVEAVALAKGEGVAEWSDYEVAMQALSLANRDGRTRPIAGTIRSEAGWSRTQPVALLVQDEPADQQARTTMINTRIS